MIEEIDVYGVFLPSLLIWMIVALLLNLLARRWLGRLGFYQYVWHRPLFDIALYILLVGAVVEIASLFT